MPPRRTRARPRPATQQRPVTDEGIEPALAIRTASPRPVRTFIPGAVATDYGYVFKDLLRITVIAAIILAAMIVGSAIWPD